MTHTRFNKTSFKGHIKTDRQGNILERTYADGSKYFFNKQGNIIKETYADGSKVVYKRDRQGNLIEKTYAEW
ncbi:MAG TPA: hypothetical protein VJL89_06190 [Thermodesulfovibrionia bacterium]|nr:hypothetical protein [Thermodesulfovibrionia bacterium]